MAKATAEYSLRINRVIDHLRANLDRPAKLDELAAIACLSEFHFHRIFSAVCGETVNGFATRLRLEKATRLLRYSRRPLTDIALDSGFSSSATFSRAFRDMYDTTPSAYRRTGQLENSKIRKDAFSGDAYRLPMTEDEKRTTFPVQLTHMPARNGTYIRVTDAFTPGRVLDALATMITWAKSQNVLDHGVMFGMSADDPHVTPTELYRYEVCLAPAPFHDCPEGMSRLSLPATTYACTRVSGDMRTVATAWDYLYRVWLIESAYEPEHAPALEIFRDKDKATDWSHFELDLCIPVRPIRQAA